MAIEQKLIRHKNLILCEGKDDINFFITYLNSDERKCDSRFANDVDVFSFGGNSKLESYLKTVRRIEGFSKVRTILIIRDAENDADQAEKQIKKALKGAGFACPEDLCEWKENEESVAVAFLLFPTLSKVKKEGALEDFCLGVIKEQYNPDEVIDVASVAMDNLKKIYLRTYTSKFKSKLHTFFR